ncbi:hypothetical protein PULV_a3693 [Pseudoalteromonas ulvae UL12]|uniref:sensor domain-containing diguanylate cyclase n=1 Tax=Pseudoalteromonas ulvae TaxID=107327 RepID=UPI00186B6E1F|nr:sensor domain-containing diguanylate cyclase [Pseudoalteromonas ulvae]MBE0362016.1 hypothetical protein [Pseudoalteromonas ulvae UL12]
MNIKKRTFLAVIFCALSIFSVISLAYILNNHVQKTESIWTEFVSLEIEKAQIMQEIGYGFGYGGFIHNFKNYVLRQEKKTYLAAKSNALLTLNAIEQYKALNTQSDTLEQLKILETTVLNYQKNLEIAHRLISKGASANDIDKQVKIDDRATIAAIAKLRLTIQNSAAYTVSLAKTNLNSTQATLVFGFAFIVTLLLISCTYIVYNLYLMQIKFKEVDTLFDSSPYAILSVNHLGLIKKANAMASVIFGYSAKQLLTMNIDSLVPDQFASAHRQHRTKFMTSEQHLAMQGRKEQLYGKNQFGQLIPVSIAVASYYTGKTKQAIAIIKDDSLELKLKKESRQDCLTKIGNRTACNELINQSIAHAKRHNQPLSVIMIDIDNFKVINDNFGHLVGDSVLEKIAGLLSAHIRETDHLFRWGGEEFIVLTPGCNESQAHELAEKLRMKAVYHHFDEHFSVSISLGVTGFHIDQDNHKTFIQRADQALYKAKNNGRNQSYCL